MLALIFAAGALAGCSGKKPAPADPTAQPTEAAATQSGDATEVPEWMWTPDPALYILGEDGFYEDDILSVYWPSYLEYSYSMSQNTALYVGRMEDGHKLALSYTVDEGGSFEDEVACYDFDGYQQYLTEGNNLYYYLEEFNFITIDGHRAMRAVYNYDPPEEPNHYTRILQYAIDVNGWILGIGFSTQAETFPKECIDSINSIKFKPGY